MTRRDALKSRLRNLRLLLGAPLVLPLGLGIAAWNASPERSRTLDHFFYGSGLVWLVFALFFINPIVDALDELKSLPPE